MHGETLKALYVSKEGRDIYVNINVNSDPEVLCMIRF